MACYKVHLDFIDVLMRISLIEMGFLTKSTLTTKKNTVHFTK